VKMASMFSIALVAGLFGATWTSQATAAGRDAAITRCLARAHRQYPGKYYDWGQTRIFVYEACMFDAGFLP
jgi:hypothetical protein